MANALSINHFSTLLLHSTKHEDDEDRLLGESVGIVQELGEMLLLKKYYALES